MSQLAEGDQRAEAVCCLLLCCVWLEQSVPSFCPPWPTSLMVMLISSCLSTLDNVRFKMKESELWILFRYIKNTVIESLVGGMPLFSLYLILAIKCYLRWRCSGEMAQHARVLTADT